MGHPEARTVRTVSNARVSASPYFPVFLILRKRQGSHRLSDVQYVQYSISKYSTSTVQYVQYSTVSKYLFSCS